MKTRVTFRVSAELADSLRELPNQTLFVERALSDALGARCPTCDGTGRLPQSSLRVSSFRRAGLPSIDRPTALSLQRVVRLARRVSATRVELRRGAASMIAFSVTRRDELLFEGTLDGPTTQLLAAPA